MITGVDYVFETDKTSYIFFYLFEEKLTNIWQCFIKEHDTDNGTLDVFYSKNQQMFDSMDDNGFHLNKNGEGSFLIIFNDDKAKKLNSVSIVLPDTIQESSFCSSIHSFIEEIV